MEELKKRLAEQKERHQGGNKWIGTGGTSPFGAYGYNPAGIRIGQHESRHRRAIKVWDKREFKDLAGTAEIGTRTIKVALRRLRQFARTGAASELDLDGTVRGTAEKGYLDVHMRAERHNAVKLLMFFDIGGSMDDHIKEVEELFSAARSEFKHLEYYYFHNCLYESVWKDNARRYTDKTDTWQVLNTYPADYKVIFVGDASMSPYEITVPGGSVEHMNEEPGALWLNRVTDIYKHAVWLNPLDQRHWDWTPSIGIVRKSDGRSHVPADARWTGRRDARADALKASPASIPDAHPEPLRCKLCGKFPRAVDLPVRLRHWNRRRGTGITQMQIARIFSWPSRRRALLAAAQACRACRPVHSSAAAQRLPARSTGITIRSSARWMSQRPLRAPSSAGIILIPPNSRTISSRLKQPPIRQTLRS